MQELLERTDFPLAAPSANRFGSVSPTTAQHVVDQLGDEVGYVLDGGPCAVGVESTIVGFDEDRCLFYRPGGIPLDEIESLVGSVIELDASPTGARAKSDSATVGASFDAVSIVDSTVERTSAGGSPTGRVGLAASTGKSPTARPSIAPSSSP
ncbi:MAG: Sua5/YciO/YrdC/YwlC family protein [Acidobacteriota bacterium]